MVVKEELKCPWCGTNFQNAKELAAHARDHYSKELIAQVFYFRKNPKTKS